MSTEPLPRYVLVQGPLHRHGTDEPRWVEHSHVMGSEPHEHDPETGFQVPVGGGRWPHEMTAGEFEAEYAERSGVTVEWLHWAGRFAEPCGCDDPECEGWAMGYQQEEAIVRNQVMGARS